jgi:hypothetical protein
MVLSERAIAFSLKERSPFSNKRDRPPRNAILFQKAGFVVGAIRESPLHYRSIPCFFQRAIAFSFKERSPFFQRAIAFTYRNKIAFFPEYDRLFPKRAIAFFPEYDRLFSSRERSRFSLKERSLFYCYNKLSERNWSFPLCLK